MKKYRFILITCFFSLCYLYAFFNSQGIQNGVYESIETMKKQILKKEEEEKFTIEIKDLKLQGTTKPARLYIFTPIKPKNNTVVLDISGTTITDLSKVGSRFAQSGYEYHGISWAEMRANDIPLLPKDCNGETSTLEKAVILTKRVLDNIKSDRIVVRGASNGGIIASLVAEDDKRVLAVIQYMSQGDFPDTMNRQKNLYKSTKNRCFKTYPGMFHETTNRLAFHGSDSKETKKMYAFISTNDRFFPFNESYNILYNSTRGYVHISTNIDHQSFGVDVNQVTFDFIDNIKNVNKVSTPHIRMNSEGEIDVEWNGVRDVTYKYSKCNDIHFCFFFPGPDSQPPPPPPFI